MTIAAEVCCGTVARARPSAGSSPSRAMTSTTDNPSCETPANVIPARRSNHRVSKSVPAPASAVACGSSSRVRSSCSRCCRRAAASCCIALRCAKSSARRSSSARHRTTWRRCRRPAELPPTRCAPSTRSAVPGHGCPPACAGTTWFPPRSPTAQRYPPTLPPERGSVPRMARRHRFWRCRYRRQPRVARVVPAPTMELLPGPYSDGRR